ncbi:integration host factor, actinobacterial type [Streptomyces sp. NPDC050264]|uniref:integration host factor, actinobacterial type n=1 Tax=Streptomyces sp. NPDC050264 TaxID=3155038 RepID=UPI00342357B2
MALPALTAQQRAEALKRAIAVRVERGEVLTALQRGTLSLREILERSGDPVVGAMRVHRLLTALPGIGEVRAGQLMRELGIPARRRVQGLSGVQRERLQAIFPDEK